MARLLERIAAANQALAAFKKLIVIENPSDVERDACIQRFEFTFEACWKVGKQYLYDIEGIDVGSPKAVIRSCREVKILDEEEAILGLQMVNDRNLTVHTYNEEIAKEIHSHLSQYYALLELWVGRMESNGSYL
ncbi:nucleotidyltransferase substrate binding protein [Lederbergia sp. NSJ-179]|uniref:HI0074 family nucleotidyltransferase substrate-binding subunit n=1 Tax=Lederbergia sp. NSJ-179 TaxID=2931402 RepID=UPI001FD398A9|nr:HI0074 family nucleotidyltransferase substrate-binding subunit [Lederbergia sp. NSJ-179]MCJ7840134.1 nucleotidyltransferase substrate binding protein [Lederbergia sp. NSJ-179]